MNARTALDLAALTTGWHAPARSWLAADTLRDRAIATYATRATRELWKYTPLNPMVEALGQLPAQSNAAWAGIDQPGIRATPFSALDPVGRARLQAVLDRCLDTDRHLLADLTLLRGADGWLIDVQGEPAAPIQLSQDAGGPSIVVLCLAPGARVHLIETQGAAPFSARMVLADVQPGARLEHDRSAFPGVAGLWSLAQVHAGQQAEYVLRQYAQGGARARLEVHVALNGRGAAAHLTGAYVVNNDQHLDQQLIVEHQAADTVSRQQFHGIGSGKGRSIFNGRIHIHPHASRSDAWLSNRNLALHPDAEMNTKPELEIYTDDVRCAHGATVGQLDGNALFFLTARGIPAPAARQLLAHAFLRECIAGALTDTVTPHLLGALP
jgi:Fe-S cluster assembly protein SufD